MTERPTADERLAAMKEEREKSYQLAANNDPIGGVFTRSLELMEQAVRTRLDPQTNLAAVGTMIKSLQSECRLAREADGLSDYPFRDAVYGICESIASSFEAVMEHRNEVIVVKTEVKEQRVIANGPSSSQTACPSLPAITKAVVPAPPILAPLPKTSGAIGKQVPLPGATTSRFISSYIDSTRNSAKGPAAGTSSRVIGNDLLAVQVPTTSGTHGSDIILALPSPSTSRRVTANHTHGTRLSVKRELISAKREPSARVTGKRGAAASGAASGTSPAKRACTPHPVPSSTTPVTVKKEELAGPFKCPTCSKELPTERGLKIHVHVHK